VSALAGAQYDLYLLTGDRRHREAAEHSMRPIAALAAARPVSFGAALAVMSRLAEPATQLVIVGDVPPAGRRLARGVTAAVTVDQAAEWAAADFELFEGRDRDAVYLCSDFVCRLPVANHSFIDPS
jgi:uncharacterized protein YyaL (SSP411 family)